MPLFNKDGFGVYAKRKLDFSCCFTGWNIETQYSQTFNKEIGVKKILEKSFKHYRGDYEEKIVNESFIKKIA